MKKILTISALIFLSIFTACDAPVNGMSKESPQQIIFKTSLLSEYEAADVFTSQRYLNYIPEKEKLARGETFTKKANKKMVSNLLRAISGHGAQFALPFCSTKGISLDDSLFKALRTTIRRSSSEPRNPENKAEGLELLYILEVKERLQKGKVVEPQLQTIKGRDIAYYPVMSTSMCLQCHGKPTAEIGPQTLSMIDTYYPDDKARGYKLNELIGIWVVEMNKE
jgi:hypothetical protein